MLLIYLNYPNSWISIHRDVQCSRIQPHQKDDQRLASLNLGSIADELRKFVDKDYAFGSSANINDMWLNIDFSDDEFELAVAYYVHRLLSIHYKPFRDAELNTCECAE